MIRSLGIRGWLAYLWDGSMVWRSSMKDRNYTHPFDMVIFWACNDMHNVHATTSYTHIYNGNFKSTKIIFLASRVTFFCLVWMTAERGNCATCATVMTRRRPGPLPTRRQSNTQSGCSASQLPHLPPKRSARLLCYITHLSTARLHY